MQATVIPTSLRYSKSHEWVQEEADNIITVGITQHAQQQLGDIVFVDLPEVGTEISASEEIAVIESVKTATDIYSPVSGTIVEINESLQDAPETINQAPFAEGWLVKIQTTDNASLQALISAEEYSLHIEED